MGQIQKTRAITPHGEQLIIELGGYAYLWCDESVPAKADEKKLSYQFPSVDEAYLRASWKPDDLLVGVDKGQLVIHAGGYPVLYDQGIIPWNTSSNSLTNLTVQSLEDHGHVAVIHCGNSETNHIEIELNRTEHKITIHRKISGDWLWTGQGQPIRKGNELRWKKASVRLIAGTFVEFDPTGYEPLFVTGFNKLKLVDPAPMKFPRVAVRPAANGEIVLEVKLLK